ncbi:MAG: DUF4276 family protein [Nitrospira sp.]|nr:DUF4276 family protein [Nitrospira sp.]
MARLQLFAEGPTEQTFADTVLKPHLAQHGVYIQKTILIANAYKKGKIYRGGGRNFDAMQKDILRSLKQNSAPDVFFTSMIDLYALPKRFPGTEKVAQYDNDPYRRVEVLEESWAENTNDKRFIPHIQLHEYEAYLFADISKLSFFYQNTAAIKKLQHIVDTVGGPPELIDDGQHTAPSKRITKWLPKYASEKVIVGAQTAERIGLAKIRSKCPHFAKWLERLENLG